MAIEPSIFKAIFPDFPRETPVLNEEGNFMPLWDLGLGSLFQALQENFKSEGILFPSLSGTNIADIQAIYTPLIGAPLPQNIPDISGQTVFDTTNRVSKQFVITYETTIFSNILAAQWNILSYLVLGSGNPNGTQAGQVGWLYYDIVGHALYMCTISGSTSSAVWTVI